MNVRIPGVRAFAIGGLLVCCAASLPIAHGAGEPDLSGDWIIDESRSDEPHEVLDKAIQGRSNRFGRVQAGVSIFGIPVDDVVDMASDSDAAERGEEERRENLHRHLSDAIDALEIVQADGTMRINYDGIHTYIYRDGATMSDGDARLHADWQRDTYVVERDYDGRATVTEVFRLDRRRPSRLYWTVSTELESGKNVSIERVYDRETAP